jgi:hypothetical protein
MRRLGSMRIKTNVENHRFNHVLTYNIGHKIQD